VSDGTRVSGETIVNNIGLGMEIAAPNAKAKATKVAQMAVSGLSSTLSSAGSLGHMFGLGYAQGILGTAEEVKKAGKKLGEAANEGVKEGTDTHSPSRVAMKLGNYYGQGYAIGIMNTASYVDEAVKEMTTVAMNGLKTASDLIASVIENDAQPTITPVLDLSEIRKGASSLGNHGNISTSITSNNARAVAAIDSNSRYGRIQNGTTNGTISSGPVYNLVIDGIKYNTDEYLDSTIHNFVESMVRKNKMYVGR
jgi:hypothetical protein